MLFRSGSSYLDAMDYAPNKNFLAGLNGKLDIMFIAGGWSPDESSPSLPTTQSDFNSRVNYVTQYYGDHPLMNFQANNANPDSSYAGGGASGAFTFNTQPRRAQGWYNITNAMLNTLSFNNTYQWVGNVWWGYEFCNAESTDWGLVTCADNPYNAHDAAASTVTCSTPQQAFQCGGEPAPGGSAVRPFGDGITLVTSANLLWLSVQPLSLPPATLGGRSLFGGISVIH